MAVPSFWERLRANLFVLATNVFNHINLGDPNTNISAPQTARKIFGIRTDGNTSGIGPRLLQLGLRLEF